MWPFTPCLSPPLPVCYSVTIWFKERKREREICNLPILRKLSILEPNIQSVKWLQNNILNKYTKSLYTSQLTNHELRKCLRLVFHVHIRACSVLLRMLLGFQNMLHVVLFLASLLASIQAMKTYTTTTTSTITATTSSFSTPKTSTSTIYTTHTPPKTPLYYTVTAIPSTSTVVTVTVANINVGKGSFKLNFLKTQSLSSASAS